MYPQITLPTRFARRSCSLIDQIFCKFSKASQQSTSGILFGALSDHFGCFSCIDIFKNKGKLKDRYIRVYNQSEDDVNRFYIDLENSLSKSSFDTNIFCDPNENYNKLESLIKNSSPDQTR